MKVKGKWGIVLTVVSILGFGYTIYLTSKKAPEAQKAKEEALKLKQETTGDESAKLTKMESIQAQVKYYAPVALTAITTVGSIIGSQFLPQSALHDIEKVHATYKELNRKLNGDKAEAAIEKMTTQKLAVDEDGIKKETFVLRFSPISSGGLDEKEIIFETTLLDVMEAEYEINRDFQIGKGDLKFNELLDIFHIQEHVEGGDQVGWEQYLGEVYFGYHWIDFTHRKGIRNGQPVTYIDLPFQCHDLTEAGIEKEINSSIANHGIE